MMARSLTAHYHLVSRRLADSRSPAGRAPLRGALQ